MTHISVELLTAIREEAAHEMHKREIPQQRDSFKQLYRACNDVLAVLAEPVPEPSEPETPEQ